MLLFHDSDFLIMLMVFLVRKAIHVSTIPGFQASIDVSQVQLPAATDSRRKTPLGRRCELFEGLTLVTLWSNTTC